MVNPENKPLILSFVSPLFRLSKLEEEHDQALDSSANKVAFVKKELETLQQETDKLRSVGFISILQSVF